MIMSVIINKVEPEGAEVYRIGPETEMFVASKIRAIDGAAEDAAESSTKEALWHVILKSMELKEGAENDWTVYVSECSSILESSFAVAHQTRQYHMNDKISSTHNVALVKVEKKANIPAGFVGMSSCLMASLACPSGSRLRLTSQTASLGVCVDEPKFQLCPPTRDLAKTPKMVLKAVNDVLFGQPENILLASDSVISTSVGPVLVRILNNPSYSSYAYAELRAPLGDEVDVRFFENSLASSTADESVAMFGNCDLRDKLTKRFISAIRAQPPTRLTCLLYGTRGVGKSTLVRHVLSRVSVNTSQYFVEIINCSELAREKHTDIMAEMLRNFYVAAYNEPSIVVLEDVEQLISTDVAGPSLAIFLAQLAKRFPRVSLIASCSSISTLHPILTESGFFQYIDQVVNLSKMERASMLREELRRHAIPVAKDLDFDALAQASEGYAPFDLCRVVDNLIMSYGELRGENRQVTFSLALKAIKKVKPISLNQVPLEERSVAWDAIGGLSSVKRTLTETLLWPSRFEGIFKKCQVKLRSGILLYGPPGCGKTLIASAVAKYCGMNFMSVKGPEILNKYIGASEQAVRDLFEKAQAAQPCVLFFDEFDSVAPRRGHDQTGVTDRIVNMMLTQLDGAEELKGVYVVAATSRPDLIDPALLRPGRLDKSLYCGLPTVEDRAEILRALSRGIEGVEGLDWDSIARKCEGWTGADLKALVTNANLLGLQRQMDGTTIGHGSMGSSVIKSDSLSTMRGDGGKASLMVKLMRMRAVAKSNGKEPNSSNYDLSISRSSDSSNVGLSMDIVLTAFKDIRPSLPKHELARFLQIYDDFQQGKTEDTKNPGLKTTFAQ